MNTIALVVAVDIGKGRNGRYNDLIAKTKSKTLIRKLSVKLFGPTASFLIVVYSSIICCYHLIPL